MSEPLQGFRFTADQAAAGEDGKAIRAAAQKGLAAEFEARAERFSNSGNHDIALASDGILRWIGAPVGTLTRTEDVLKPRVILLADEQLNGPARDKVLGEGGALRQFPDRDDVEAVDRSQAGRAAERYCARHRLPAGREFRPDQPPRHRRRGEVARPGRPCRVAPPGRPVRRLPHFRAGTGEAGAGQHRDPAVGPEERRQGQARLR